VKPTRTDVVIKALRTGHKPAKRSAKATALVKALEAQGARHRLLVQMLRDGGSTKMASRDYCKLRLVLAEAEEAVAFERRVYGRHAFKFGKHMASIRATMLAEHERWEASKAIMRQRRSMACELWIADLPNMPLDDVLLNELGVR
jgi:hypothetical protein